MGNLLIISHDIVASRMAGVGIRYFETARALSRSCAVRLAVPTGSALPLKPGDVSPFDMVIYDPLDLSTLTQVIMESDVVFAYPDMLWQCREFLDRDSLAVVVDGYDLTLLEHLEMDAVSVSLEDQLAWQTQQQQMNDFVLRRGDFFLCATGRQRDWWLGSLAVSGRINALTYRDDPSLMQLVNLLPYGIPSQSPQHTRMVMRGILPGITPQDKIVLWGGGIWQWLDPITLIRAAAIIGQQRSDVKFVFPGVRHPAVNMAATMTRQQQAYELAETLGLLNRSVFMGDWIEYEEWPNYLMEADLGISLHLDHLEAHMSSRTRVLSYLWAGLPMVLTRGDELAERMARAGVATLVEEGNPEVVANAILATLQTPRDHPTLQTAFESLRTSWYWDHVVRPLVVFCDHPGRAPDATRIASSPSLRHSPTPLNPLKQGSFDGQEVSPVAISPLTIPRPVTFLNRLLSPILRSLFLWYLAAVTEQQNRINATFKIHMDKLQDDLQAERWRNEQLAKQVEQMMHKVQQIQQVADRIDDVEMLQTEVLADLANQHLKSIQQ